MAYRCPVCTMAVAPESPSLPFCGERCRLVDLGRWFDGSYRVSRRPSYDDEEVLPSLDEPGEDGAPSSRLADPEGSRD